MPSYNVTTEKFEGPIETLLNLIEEHKLSVNEISLAAVANQYFDYIQTLPELPRREAAAFLVVASTLLLIKSKSLLPSLELSTEEQSSIQDLERRLALYKKMKELAHHIDAAYGTNIMYGREAFSGINLGFVEPKGVDIAALHIALSALVKALPLEQDLPEKSIAPVVKLEDRIQELCERVRVAAVTSFKDVAKAEDRANIIVSFLAILELIKRGLVDAKQEGSFAEIEIMKI